MGWLLILVLAVLVLGVILAIRERRTGRGRIIDERRPIAQTEADRDRIRAEGSQITRHNWPGHPGGDSDSH